MISGTVFIEIRCRVERSIFLRHTNTLTYLLTYLICPLIHSFVSTVRSVCGRCGRPGSSHDSASVGGRRVPGHEAEPSVVARGDAPVRRL